MSTPGVPVYFYTRLGLGISDERWLEFRLALFRAITLPSIGRLCRDGVSWVIFIDTWMPMRFQRGLRQAVAASSAAPWIRIEPIDFMVQLRPRMSEITRDHETVTLVRVDDDDALVGDFVERIPAGLGVTTWPRGYEVLLGEGVYRPLHSPYHSMNTAATVEQKDVREQVRISHTDQGTWASERGLPVRVVGDQDAVYFYSRHQLADSGYAKARRRILDDASTREVDEGLYRGFGIDVAALTAWRRLAEGHPGVRKHAYWTGSYDPNREALVLLEQAEEIHRKIWQLNSDLLER